MKRILLSILTAAVMSLPVWSTDFTLPAFAPLTPEIKGQGGTVVAATSGYNTLYGNPAAFASDHGSLTLLSLNPTGNISLGAIKDLAVKLNQATALGFSDPVALAGTLDSFLKEGLGAQVNAGLGLTFGGLGIGAAVQGSVLLKEGATLLGTSIKADIIEGAVIGYAIPLDTGLAKVRLGLDLRPMQRSYAEYSLANLSDLMAGKAYLANGFGLAFDLGVQADLLGATFGLAIRDVGSTKFAMSRYLAEDVISGATFPSAALGTKITADSYTTPMTITPAVSYSPDLGLLGVLIQPKISAEVTLPALGSGTMPSLLASSHLGAEVKLLSFLAIRAGLNQGYATLGLGAHLLIVDANIAVYSDELGSFAGQNKKSGIAAELAFRF